MMETRRVYSFYVVTLKRIIDDAYEEVSKSYHEKEEDAKRVALSLCKMWLEDPWAYLVTTDGYKGSIRVYDKEKDRTHAVVFIEEHRFVEVG